MNLRTGLRRLVVATGCAVALAAGAITASAVTPLVREGGGPQAAVIAPAVAAELAGSGSADFWIHLSARADTSKARSEPNRTRRGQQVVDALRSTAQVSQAGVRAVLDAEGADYESFWVSNAIRVRGGSAALAEKVAAIDAVERIAAPPRIELIEPVSRQAADAVPNAVEWGIANINADDVWSQHGVRGEGIVVANIDTGVQFDHPALVGQYRGNNGDGTFDHDYNWFDAQGSCQDGPCDANGHGTHTMGTMAGDDGTGNQIGVAPAVTWIAANGCCPSDDALLRSSQWMLAPTDLDGQNPDVSKRPHIVNNSWGSEFPSTEPLFEDIQRAWADSGIFGVWANGNSGPSCSTSGSPGSRTLNYSVGAYDATNTIARFSARGPGQDGEIKPNISAPGVAVRSSLPGGSYGVLDGTSMAAPHVAGAVALLWSANPGVERDVATTRQLLDLTAIDTLNDQCGGTAADNNVFGEGRLDALALVAAGARGVAQLSGRVTDEVTGAPIADATVSATGPVTRTTRTGADGSYTLRLLAGQYQVAVTGVFGYADRTSTVELASGEAEVHDIALSPLARVEISGTITDGSGQGWPLPADVTAVDDAGHTFTATADPDTGRYALMVVPHTTYTVTATPTVPGYQQASRRVAVGDTGQTVDLAAVIHPSCTARGYRAVLTGQTETFDRKTPRGWSVTNHNPGYPGYAATPGWVFTDEAGRTNTTGSSGGFAIVDSDHLGQHHVQDTVLTGPVVNLSGATTPALQFGTTLAPAPNGTATIELSTDAGRTWTQVWTNTGHPGLPGPNTEVVHLPQAAGEPDTMVRFHYTGQWSGWWQLDNVFLGQRTCEVVPA